MALNIALYAALRIAAAILPRLPLALAYRLASLAGTWAYHLFPGPRRALAGNLAVVLDRDPSDPLVDANVRRAFKYDAKNWVDTLRIDSLSPEEILDVVDVDGWEYLEAALARGRGVVMAVLHLGNIDMVGQVLAARGWRVTVPVEHMRPQALFDFLQARRRSKGMNMVPVERASREMLLALRRGEIVAIAADRNLAGRGIQVTFFGRPALIPRGPAALVRHTGAAMVLGFGIRLTTNRFHGYVVPIGESTEVRGEAGLAQDLAATMERFIRQYPDQWLMFTPFWPGSAGENPPATIEHPTGAAV